jgi:hypothetical protein
MPWQEVFDQMARQLGIPPAASSGGCSTPASAERAPTPRDFLTFAQLADRWGVSRATVYNRLRALGAKVLDFSPRGKRSRKAVSLAIVAEIERRQSKRLQ